MLSIDLDRDEDVDVQLNIDLIVNLIGSDRKRCVELTDVVVDHVVFMLQVKVEIIVVAVNYAMEHPVIVDHCERMDFFDPSSNLSVYYSRMVGVEKPNDHVSETS